MSNSESEQGAALSPDDAFAVLGDETRMEILRALGAADETLSFTELHDRVGIRDSGQFNYHLDKLLGHFVRKTTDGYVLRQEGRRVIEAVLSGAVTEDPVIEPSRIDEPCPLCGAGTVVAYHQESLHHYCTECSGLYDGSPDLDSSTFTEHQVDELDTFGYLGSFQLPAAGLQERTPEAVFRTAAVWGILELLAVAGGVCPRCSAELARTIDVCDGHQSETERCENCNRQHAIQVSHRCNNCIHELETPAVVSVLGTAEVLEFLLSHGLNPVATATQPAFNAAVMNYEAELRSTDPLEARITIPVEGDALTVTIDEELNVIETRS